jgi:hypothetical protein
MPWREVRGGRYFYRCRRVGGRPVQLHLGRGPAAELAAAADDLLRVERAAAARERRDEQARVQAAESPLLALCRAADVLSRAALVAAGFHQHARSTWRRKRHARDPNNSPDLAGNAPGPTARPGAAC